MKQEVPRHHSRRLRGEERKVHGIEEQEKGKIVLQEVGVKSGLRARPQKKANDKNRACNSKTSKLHKQISHRAMQKPETKCRSR